MSARKVKRGAGAKGGDGAAAAVPSTPPVAPPAAPHVAPAAAQGRGGLRRVAITGMGTVNALGRNVPDTLTAMREARCGIGELEFQDVDRLSVRIGAQVRDWDPEAYFNRQQISLYDKFTQFTMIAAKEAVAQSGLSFHGELGLCSGVILGTAGGGLNTWDENYRIVYEEGKNRVHPFVVPKLMNNAAASHVSMEFGLRGPAFTVATACASSNHAMGLAFQMPVSYTHLTLPTSDLV